MAKKSCPNCSAETGVRTHLCECGWHYVSKELRKDLLEEKKKKAEPRDPSIKRGLKKCTNCGDGVGYRTQLCKCGWYFPEAVIRKDLLEEKKKKAITPDKIYDSLGQGRKKCPGCNIIVGAILKTCFKCNFDFSAAKKRKDEKIAEEKAKKEESKAKTSQGEKISPVVAKLLMESEEYEAPKKLTPKEQAMRILSYGKERAESLLRMSKMSHWSHVDWNVVEQELGLGV